MLHCWSGGDVSIVTDVPVRCCVCTRCDKRCTDRERCRSLSLIDTNTVSPSCFCRSLCAAAPCTVQQQSQGYGQNRCTGNAGYTRVRGGCEPRCRECLPRWRVRGKAHRSRAAPPAPPRAPCHAHVAPLPPPPPLPCLLAPPSLAAAEQSVRRGLWAQWTAGSSAAQAPHCC